MDGFIETEIKTDKDGHPFFHDALGDAGGLLGTDGVVWTNRDAFGETAWVATPAGKNAPVLGMSQAPLPTACQRGEALHLAILEAAGRDFVLSRTCLDAATLHITKRDASMLAGFARTRSIPPVEKTDDGFVLSRIGNVDGLSLAQEALLTLGLSDEAGCLANHPLADGVLSFDPAFLEPGDIDLLGCLAAMDPIPPLVIEKGQDGYFVHVAPGGPDDMSLLADQYRAAGMSDSFMALLGKGLGGGFTWIELDDDGTVHTDIPVSGKK